VHLPHSPLTPASDYVRHFGCSAHFAQPTAGFVLRGADLRRRLRRDDQTHHSAVAELSELITDGRAPLIQVVTDMIRTLLPTGALGVELVASQLGLHPRTLQRRLAAENASFASLVDNVRSQNAQRYLRDTDISLEHLTRLLGYSEQSVLTRSCQRWFSTTPTGYRETGP
jgi:AraC-like DNA-binding protein